MGLSYWNKIFDHEHVWQRVDLGCLGCVCIDTTRRQQAMSIEQKHDRIVKHLVYQMQARALLPLIFIEQEPQIPVIREKLIDKQIEKHVETDLHGRIF